MKMVAMKPTAAEKKAREKEFNKPYMGSEEEGPRLHLDHEHLEKLGIDKLPKVGSKLKLQVHAHVSETGEDKRNGKGRRRMTIHITHIGHDGGDEKSEQAKHDDLTKGARSVMDAALKDAGSESEGDGEND
jgi:hypothetical protein